jgi:hypothetical protein
LLLFSRLVRPPLQSATGGFPDPSIRAYKIAAGCMESAQKSKYACQMHRYENERGEVQNDARIPQAVYSIYFPRKAETLAKASEERGRGFAVHKLGIGCLWPAN